MKKKSGIILIVIFSIIFAAAAAVLLIQLIPTGNDYSDYKNGNSEITSNQPELPDNPIDFASLTAQNSEACGWIKVDGTNADNPIMQSGENTVEDYYLNHDLNGNTKTAGSVYIQKINSADFTDPVTVIYGHNMLNGTMFGTLKRFRNKDFFNSNRYIYIYTPGHILTYEIISAFTFDDRHILYSYNFNIEESKLSFFDQCVNPKSVTKNVLEGASLNSDDRLAVLSTCTSNENQRYLVVGKLISDTKTK